MKRIRVITTAITAITALLALTALTGIATAETTKILPEPTAAAPTSFVIKGGIGRLETVDGSSIECKKSIGEGTFTNANLGYGKTLFEECKSEIETTCTGVGDAAGTISVPGTIHYVLALEMITATTSTLVAAFAFLVPQFHFTCTKILELLVLARGCVAGEASFTDTLTKVVVATFKEFSKGENVILSILMENNTKAETKCLLETSISEERAGEDFELAALIGSFALSTWTQSDAEIEILLMN